MAETNTGGIGNLFKNKLFLQYLSGAGGAISAGQPVGPALNEATQKNIQSQNFMKLLQQMMGDAASPNTPAKATFDGTTFNYKTDMTGIEGMEGVTATPGTGAGKTTGTTPTPTQQTNQSLSGMLNPSGSSAFNSADLAGLTPENISQALQFKLTQEQLADKKMTDLVDMMYKGALINQANALAEKSRRPEYLEGKFPVEVPGIGEVTQRQWNALPTSDKEYSLFVATSKKLGDTEIMSKQEFGSLTPSERENFLRAAMDDPKLMEAAKAVARAGATTIGDITGRTGATADVKAKKYFTSPEGLVEDVDKHVSSEEVQSRLFQYADDPRKMEIETTRAKEKFISNKIVASGGEIVEAKLEGRTFVFTVKWQDGTTSEVKYAN